MITQDTRCRAAVRAAPVSYAEVRTASRLTRAGIGITLLSLAAVGWASGISGTPVKAAAAAVVVLHAALDARSRSALLALVADAVLLCATAGLVGELHGPLVAVVAYLLTAAILLLPRCQVTLVIAALGAGTALRLSAGPSASGVITPSSAALAGVESALYLTALGLLGLGTARWVSRSRRHHAEALETEQRAAAMKNEFVSMVSHELRTPLTNIAGFALSLRESWRTFDPAEVDEFLEVVCREADHLRALVDDVLVIPRLEAGRLPIELADFSLRPAAFRIAEVVFPAGGDASISVSVSGSAVVRADPNRVEQVLRNLLENAARHGGSQVSVEAAHLGSEWMVTVADDGPGINPDHQERVFGAFEQAAGSDTPGNGLGLGLTVSRVLVEAMGGRIWYEAGFPTGARFCFTLPAASSRRDVPMPAVT